MEKVYDYLKEKGWNLQHVQAFIPTPMTLATAMYWTGIDPMSKKDLFVPKEWKDRKVQQALLQPHKPGNEKIIEQYKFQKNQKAIGSGKASVNPGLKTQVKPQLNSQGRTIVDVPRNKLGRKLFLDTR